MTSTRPFSLFCRLETLPATGDWVSFVGTGERLREEHSDGEIPEAIVWYLEEVLSPLLQAGPATSSTRDSSDQSV